MRIRILSACARRAAPLASDPGIMPTHAEKRVLPHAAERLFDLVADVKRYPEFLPWCVGVRIRQYEDTRVLADMVIGYKVFRERFSSVVTLSRPDRIDVEYSDGPFKYLKNYWIFRPVGESTCEIDFYVDFEFRSRLLQKMIVPVFNQAVRRMVTAFELRADDLYD
jgi:coenzyme Q-binding protein COQ10